MYPYFRITHQERFSRAELLLRTFFGWLYILIPHGFVLGILGIVGSLFTFISFWMILFTGQYPEFFFEFQRKLFKWNMRVNASFMNLVDGYPAFGLEQEHPNVILDIPYPESLGQMHVLAKVFFGWLYCLIPHGLILIFRYLATMIITFLAFFIVLITGKYPLDLHAFNVGTLRWSLRVNLYMNLMTDGYPPFHGKPMGELIDLPVNPPTLEQGTASEVKEEDLV